ncbi:MAG: type II toxin-antitoxin system VapC family toxin [Mesorhizobium sp.]|nr:type II toxin-antitoxin system VapC family toxin [Mesorhizobium sp.]MBL8578680.1 type II toxin-antitoxin system VapC family toxin [Mesorhizobium sp.]
MIEYLLDTNTVIALVGGKSGVALERLDRIEPGAVGVSSVVAHELYFGAYKSQKVAHNLETLRLLFTDLVIVDFDQGDAHAAGEIRADLARNGTPIGPYDVLIAGQARHRSATLVTNNLGEFRRVANLRLEDWTA